MKKPTLMMMLNRIDKEKGLVRVFVKKDQVESVSRLKIGGRQGNTSVVYKNRQGRRCIISVLEDPSYIMNKIAF